MSLLTLLRSRRGPSGFGASSTAEEVTADLDLAGKRVLVTGPTSGLGLETARVLGLRGATIIGLARTEERAGRALASIPGAERHVPIACDLSEPDSVRRAVEAVDGPLDAIVCNAGRLSTRHVVVHGIELQFLVNHLGHFVLVTGLLDQLREHGRIVMVSSGAWRLAPAGGLQLDDLAFSGGYAMLTAYGHSKLANLLFARELARRLAGTTRTVNALHPGEIATDIARDLPSWLFRMLAPVVTPLALKTIPQGAATQCFVATHPSLDGVSGAYFEDCNVVAVGPPADDPALAEALWARSEELAASL